MLGVTVLRYDLGLRILVAAGRDMVKEGYYLGVPPLLLGVVAFLAHWTLVATLVLCLAALIFYFFRDPERVIPSDPGAVVSPADGRVVVVTDETHEQRPGTRISIFLAIWNVHVNRSPAAGAITSLEYCPGRFLAAMRERASAENERNVISLSTSAGQMIIKQIAGVIARRVVCWKKPGDRVERGERIGLVRFGSRVDLWVPQEAQLLVAVGQTVKGGSSVVALWPALARSDQVRKQSSGTSEENLEAAGKRT